MKAIKRGVVLAAVIVLWGLSGAFSQPSLGLWTFAQTNTQSIRLGPWSISPAMAQMLATNLVPEFGNFIMLKEYELYGEDAIPLPFSPYPQNPTYSFDATNIFLVDNVVTNTTSDTTNSPLVSWPVSLSDLQLVAPENVPEFGTFYLYQDQLAGDSPEPAPCPFDPFPQCPVYSLGVEGLYLVDDSGVTRSEPQQGSSSEYAEASSAADALKLGITTVSGGAANLMLQGTEPGRTYEILSCRALTAAAWNSEKMVVGVSNQNWTPVRIAIGDRVDSLFFWARAQDNLWLEIPAGGLAVPGQLSVLIHNTVETQPYTVLTKESLTDPSWAQEQPVAGAAGNTTTVQLSRTGRSSLFVWACAGEPSTLAILSPPLDQLVWPKDTVTFSVVAVGSGVLNYQWKCNGADIPGATASSYTMNNVQSGDDQSEFTVVVSDARTSVSASAQLTVYPEYLDGSSLPLGAMIVCGKRQDYSFREGMTYYILYPVGLFGTTKLAGGSVLKFASYAYSSLVVKGSLVCDTRPYYPAILTSVDDDSVGQWLGTNWSSGSPWPSTNGYAYLDLSGASSSTISNLRICFADQGVTTPASSRQLDVWDCQFVGCNVAVANQAPGFGARDIFHNVLFARCGAAIGASTNQIEIEGEQVTADATNFWIGPILP